MVVIMKFSQGKLFDPIPVISNIPSDLDLSQLVTLGQELANRSSNFFQSQPDIISALCFVGYFAYSLLGVKF
jgi:hypothetical protein